MMMAGCGKGSDPVPETDRVRGFLTGTAWQVSQVSIDGVSKTSSFSGLTLTFTATGYTTANGRLVWPATGTWQFKDDTGKLLLRSDGVEVTITDVTTTTLSLSFNWATTTLGPGRVTSTAGKHDFQFVRN